MWLNCLAIFSVYLHGSSHYDLACFLVAWQRGLPRKFADCVLINSVLLNLFCVLIFNIVKPAEFIQTVWAGQQCGLRAAQQIVYIPLNSFSTLRECKMVSIYAPSYSFVPEDSEQVVWHPSGLTREWKRKGWKGLQFETDASSRTQCVDETHKDLLDISIVPEGIFLFFLFYINIITWQFWVWRTATAKLNTLRSFYCVFMCMNLWCLD